ncbi:MAG: hypothetical protein JWM19_1927 [Actinomycetia bacterium]|nr:hypothetical protein [Actinomycetes bacterium]
MSELRSSTETTDPATSDALTHSEASPGAGYDGHRAAQAAEDRLPLRQDARTAWDDDPHYDEADPDADYDGDLEALMADDRLPPRQAFGTASWDDDPWYDEAGLAAEYDGDLDALTADGHATATGEEHAPDGGEGDQAAPDDVPPATAKPGDPPAEPPGTSTEAAPGQDDGNVTAPGYAAGLDSLATGDRTPDTGEDHTLDGGNGDQGQDAAGEVPSATASPDDPPAEAPGISAVAAPEREDGDFTAPGSSPAGASADTSSVAGADAGEPPHDEAAQAGQADAPGGQEARPGDGHADQEGAPEASLEQLKAELRAELKAELMAELKAELQAPKDRRQAAPDVPGNTGREADQPRFSDRELPVDQDNVEAAEHKDDRPGLLSNAKVALYGAVGTVGAAAVLGEYFPGVSPVIAGIAAGAVTIASTLVPVVREGWKRIHDNTPAKP